MRVVILQPGYLPWLGFFDLMYKADFFVIFNDVQYTVRDWRNRNRIKTPNGVIWLTVPVESRGAREKLIKDVEIDNTQKWQERHLKSLESFYKRAKYFDEVMALIADLFKKTYRFLIDVDMDFIMKVRDYLSIDTKILFSSEIPSRGKKDEKLLSICKFLNSTCYLSGNTAKNYLRESIFAAEGIKVEWHDYQHPYYNQLWQKEQGFISHLSIIDLLFNHGPYSLAILTGEKVIPKPNDIVVRHAHEVWLNRCFLK
jgi:hypothetical protein